MRSVWHQVLFKCATLEALPAQAGFVGVELDKSLANKEFDFLGSAGFVSGAWAHFAQCSHHALSTKAGHELRSPIKAWCPTPVWP